MMGITQERGNLVTTEVMEFPPAKEEEILEEMEEMTQMMIPGDMIQEANA